MSNANNFMASFQTGVVQLINQLEDLNTLQDRLAQDATLAGSAANSPLGIQLGLSAADITNAASAVNQIIFAYNSGSPPQKAMLFKLL
jgi:hypothetical protein